MNPVVTMLATVAVPLLGAGIVVLCARHRDVAAAVATVTSLVAAVAAVTLVGQAPPWRSGSDLVVVDVPWIGLLGSRLHLGWDGVSAPLVVLTSVLGVLSCGYLWVGGDDAQPGDTHGRPPHPLLLTCLLVTQAGAVATFLARDLLVFFIAFETVLVPMWLIIGRWGQPAHAGLPAHLAAAERRSAATTFVLYTAAGSAVLLVGLVWLASAAGTTDMVAIAAARPLAVPTQTGIATLLLIGLAVKVPAWPLHSWLAPAHTTAPTIGSVLLAGVLLKLGSYGLVRVVAGLVPDGLAAVALPLAISGVTGILWGGLVCLVERDLKRLIAFSSVAHMGFAVLGVASGTPEGLQAALFVGVAHGVVTSLLFWVVGMLKHRHHDVRLDRLPAGLRDSAPRLGWMLALGAIAGAAVPGLAGFWGELLAIIGAWRSPVLGATGPWLAGAAVCGTVLAAGYLMRVLYLVWQGRPPVPAPAAGQPEPSDATPPRTDLTPVELTVTAPLAVATLAFGVLPWLLLSTTGPAVRALLGGPG